MDDRIRFHIEGFEVESIPTDKRCSVCGYSRREVRALEAAARAQGDTPTRLPCVSCEGYGGAHRPPGRYELFARTWLARNLAMLIMGEGVAEIPHAMDALTVVMELNASQPEAREALRERVWGMLERQGQERDSEASQAMVDYVMEAAEIVHRIAVKAVEYGRKVVWA